MSNTSSTSILLRDILTSRFNESELRTLCFDLGANYDILSGSGVEDKSRELIAHLNRRRRLGDLVEWGQRVRPDINWPEQAITYSDLPESRRFATSITKHKRNITITLAATLAISALLTILLTNTSPSPEERQALTVSANATATAISTRANLAFGPKSDWITSPYTNTFVTFTPPIQLHDLIIEASFNNLDVGEDNRLSYGFPIRIFRDYPNKEDWEAHSIIVYPQSKTWTLQKGTFTKYTLANGKYREDEIAGGESQYIKSLEEQANKIKVIAVGSTLLLYINDEFVERINTKDISKKGDLGISVRIQGKNVQETNIEYTNFTVWSLDP